MSKSDSRPTNFGVSLLSYNVAIHVDVYIVMAILCCYRFSAYLLLFMAVVSFVMASSMFFV